jgi:hypothetical protein
VTSLEQLSIAEFSGEQARLKVYKNGHRNVLAIWLDLVSNIKIWAQFLKIKYIKNQSYQNMSIIKVVLLFLYSSMKFFFRKIQLIFDIGKWL